MTENSDKISRKIARAIRHRIRKIEDGYKRVASYRDKFFGEYVNVYYCENGYEGESWEIDVKIDNEIYKLKQNIVLNGFIYGGKKYFIDGEICFKSYYDNNFVKLISEKQHKRVRHYHNFLTNIIDKVIKARKMETNKEEKEYREMCADKNSIQHYNPYYVQKLNDRNYSEAKNMNKLAYHSIDAFRRSYDININTKENQLPFHMLVDYITDKEKEILFYQEMTNINYKD